MFDAELYRTKEEVEEWKQRDPIPRLSRSLKEQGLLDAAGFEGLEREAAGEVAAAIDFAEAGTLEPVAELTRFVSSERSNR